MPLDFYAFIKESETYKCWPHYSGSLSCSGQIGSKSLCIALLRQTMFKIEVLYEFRFEGLSNFNPSVERPVQIQDVNPKI